MPATGLMQDINDRARRLLSDVGGDRAELLRRRDVLQRRLRRRSSDFDATDGLRVVETALRLAGHRETLGSRWHEREVG